MAKYYGDKEKTAKAFYGDIGSIPCPKLGGEEVHFNNMGFRHLILKRGVRRSKKERERRFASLAAAEEIIKKPDVSISTNQKRASHRTGSHGRMKVTASRAQFWRL